MDDEFKAKYKKLKRIALVRYTAIGIALSAVLTICTFFVVFHGYTVPKKLNLLEAFAAGALCFSTGLYLIFGQNYIMSGISKQYSKNAKKKFRNENKELFETKHPEYVGLFFAVIGLIAVFILSIHCVGFGETQLKFSDEHNMLITKARYSEFDLYKLEGYWDSDEYGTRLLLYGDNAYGIVSHDGKRSFDFGNCDEEMTALLKAKFGKHYARAESIDDAIVKVKGKK